QGPAGLARLEAVVVGPADDQVPRRGLAAVGDPDGAACVDEAEVDQGAADAAVLVVLVQRGGVSGAEAEGGGAFPGGGEPDGFGELDVAEPVGEEHHGAAAFDRGELFLVSGQDELAAVAGG